MSVLYKREIESAPDPEVARREKVAEYAARFSGPFEALQKQYAQAAIRPLGDTPAPDPGPPGP